MYFYQSNKFKGENWFRRGFGRWVATVERRICGDIVRDIFGLYAAQVGSVNRALLGESPMRHHYYLGENSGDVRCHPPQLPFKSESVDLLLLAHALEASADAHAVLREAVRVLRPEGRIIVVGFNPWSVLGVSAGAPWRRDWVSVARLKDWLALLNMQPLGGSYAVFLPPWKSRRWRWMESAGRRWWPLAGGVFFLHAVKRRHGMRPIAPMFKRKRSQPDFIGVGGEKPIQ